MLLFLAGFVILILSIILHEVAHGYAANYLGDPTARISGRLTLNPIPHIDPVMSVALPLILVLSGSPVIFGSAKPVPIDPFNFRESRKDMGIVGLAGPGTNLALAILAALLTKILLIIDPPIYYTEVPLALLRLMAFYNLLLAAFNLIPIPPLDGSRILAAILPEKQAHFLDFLEPYGIFILFFLLLFPVGGFSLGYMIFNLVSFWLRLLGF
ncbi:site-2 protease family protein [Candidatus Microgenomates bacterium]|nr:site-2 protease family protein [Candidatus Microgenomates bacterium]